MQKLTWKGREAAGERPQERGADSTEKAKITLRKNPKIKAKKERRKPDHRKRETKREKIHDVMMQ